MHCPVCNTPKIKKKFHLTPKQILYKCLCCAVEFLFPVLSEQDLKKIYSEKYYISLGIFENDENEDVKTMKMKTFYGLLDIIRQYHPLATGGKILDVGCATGYFLDAAFERGFEPYGVEISDYAAYSAKKKYGNAVFSGVIENCPFSENFFDIIVMTDVIEHAVNPVSLISKAVTLLKEDGIMLITTPDTGSFLKKISGRQWQQYKPEHLFYFNYNALHKLISKRQMKIISSAGTKKALSIKYLYNHFGTYRNKLFTPLIKCLYYILPDNFHKKIFLLKTDEITVVLKKQAQ